MAAAEACGCSETCEQGQKQVAAEGKRESKECDRDCVATERSPTVTFTHSSSSPFRRRPSSLAPCSALSASSASQPQPKSGKCGSAQARAPGAATSSTRTPKMIRRQVQVCIKNLAITPVTPPFLFSAAGTPETPTRAWSDVSQCRFGKRMRDEVNGYKAKTTLGKHHHASTSARLNADRDAMLQAHIRDASPIGTAL
jgi:hypothetical protein